MTKNTMTGAESLVHTLLAGGIDVCFANPGTSEMHFVAALDTIPGMRCVLGLQENVVTGAADGYARMAEKPAVTLLHLGSGLSNGLANLHNARKAKTPMVNVVGEHATYHIKHDAPLTSDIASIAKPVSDWFATATDPQSVATLAAQAIEQCQTSPGGIATMLLPGDCAWNGGATPVEPKTARPAPHAPDEAIANAAKVLQSGEPTLLLLAFSALQEEGLMQAAKITQKTGAEMLAPVSNPRLPRGEGRPNIDRIPYPVKQALERLEHFKHIILVGAKEPVAFFAYPGKPGLMAPEDCQIHTLTTADQDQIAALTALAEATGATEVEPLTAKLERPALPTGDLTPDSIAYSLAALMPEEAIIIDEAVTSGRALFSFTETAPRHDWLQLTGGAIGIGHAMATGASIACPDRKVICLEADGSGMYSPQALWTQARENLDITTIIYANRTYEILKGEMINVGFEKSGKTADDMFSLDNPAIDWVMLANSMGVEAVRAETAEQFNAALKQGLETPGPFLIEALI